MNLDDCKLAWKQRHEELAQESLDRIRSDVVGRAARLEAAIKRRDLIEVVAAVLVLLALGLFLGQSRVPMPTLLTVGAVIIMLAAIEVVAVMHWTRRREPRLNFDLPLLDFYAAEVRRLDRQIQLSKNVTWWYSGPILVGACVLIFGVLSAVPELPVAVFFGFLAAFYACFVAIAIIISRGSRRAAAKDLVPLRDELLELMKTDTGRVPLTSRNTEEVRFEETP